MTKNILITGASGYLGQHLISSLCSCDDSSYKICAAYGSLETFEGDLSKHLRTTSSSSTVALVKNFDLTCKDAIADTIDSHGPFDAVVHLAAISSPGVCENTPDKAKAINVPTALLEAFEASSPEVIFIFLSTDQVYDGLNAPYVETDDAKPVNLYGRTKYQFERLLHAKFPNTAIALRSSLIVGPKSPFSCRKQTFLQFVHDRLKKQEETSFFTDEFRNVVYVGDICKAIRHFIDNPGINGTYCMGGAERVSRLDIAHAIAKHCGLDMTCAKGVARASLPPGPVASPPDISIDSSKLEQATGFKMLGLSEIVQLCFSSSK